MRRAQRLKSAQSWLQTYDGEPKKIVKAYRKKYGVDWPTAFRELEMLEVEIDPAYREQVLLSFQQQWEAKQLQKRDSDDDFFFDEWDIPNDEFDGFQLPVQQRSMSKKDIPYDDFDSNIVSLVKALNAYPSVVTIGSCGGHEHPTSPAQWEAGSWYVKFNILPDKTGWYVLEHLAWAVNEDCRLLDGDDVILMPVSPPPYLNTPGQCLSFVIEGHQGADPDALATFLVEARQLLTKKRR